MKKVDEELDKLEQLPVRKLIEIIVAQANELKSCEEIFREYAENNLADKPLHKLISAKKACRVGAITFDYDELLREWKDEI